MGNDFLSIYKAIFAPIAYVIPILPLVLGIIKFRTLGKNKISIVCLTLVASVISIYSTYQSKNGINNLASLHLLTALEFTFVVGFYFFTFPKPIHKQVLIYIWLAFIIFTLINSFYIQPTHTYNSYARGLESFVLLSISMAYLLYRVSSNDSSDFKNEGIIWIVFAFLFYFGSTQFLFLFENQLGLVSKAVIRIAFKVHLSVNIIYYSLLAKGLWTQK